MEVYRERLHPAFRYACVALIVIGCAYRAAMAWRLPVGYDEIFVIALGLEEIREGNAGQWLEVPLRRSAAITPLWWWAMAVPTVLAGEISLEAIRTIPVLLGLMTPWLAWWVARKRCGGEAALVFATLVATSDLLSFSNVRGEYFESMLTPLALVAAAWIGDWRRPVLKGLVWLGLIMTFFGKGLVIVVLAALAEGVFWIGTFRQTGKEGQHHRPGPGSVIVTALICVLPVLAYLFLADRYIDGMAEFRHASLESRDVWALAYDTTLGYSETRSHMVSGIRQALQVYWDAYVWPLTCLLTVPMLFALVMGLWWVVRSFRVGPMGPAETMFAGLAVWVLAGVGMVALGGKVGGRFHLLYLPAAWLLTAMMFCRQRTCKTLTNQFALKFALIACWTGHVALSTSILIGETGEFSRTKILTMFVLGSAWAMGLDLIYWRLTKWGRPMVTGFGVAAMVITVLIAGPWQWGTWSRFEPMAGSKELMALDQYRVGAAAWPGRERGTLSIYLCNYYKESGAIPKALLLGERAVQETPENVLAWTYLGFAYEAAEKPVEEQRRVWGRALALKPESELIQQKLANLK